MTDRKRFEIAEKKQAILEQDQYRCTYPGCTQKAVNLAHGISKAKVKLYGDKIVNHPYNLFSVCTNSEHNDYFNITGHRGKIEKLICLIKYVENLNSKTIWKAINSIEPSVFLNIMNKEMDYREAKYES